MWPSVTKWGSLRGVSKLRKVFNCNKHYFLHILIQKWLLYDFLSKVTKCWTLPYMMSCKITSQGFGLLKILICMYFYGPIKKKMFHNTSFLPHFHWKKSVWHDCVWYDKDLERIISKMKNLDLGSYFCHNSKSVLLQRSSFSHAGTHGFGSLVC